MPPPPSPQPLLVLTCCTVVQVWTLLLRFVCATIVTFRKSVHSSVQRLSLLASQYTPPPAGQLHILTVALKPLMQVVGVNRRMGEVDGRHKQLPMMAMSSSSCGGIESDGAIITVKRGDDHNVSLTSDDGASLHVCRGEGGGGDPNGTLTVSWLPTGGLSAATT